jgi:hypothetical protein
MRVIVSAGRSGEAQRLNFDKLANLDLAKDISGHFSKERFQSCACVHDRRM